MSFFDRSVHKRGFTQARSLLQDISAEWNKDGVQVVGVWRSNVF